MRKVISLMEKDASRSQIRDAEIREGFIVGRLRVENASRNRRVCRSAFRNVLTVGRSSSSKWISPYSCDSRDVLILFL